MREYWKIAGTLLLLVSGARAATPVQGRVLDAECSGVPNLVVKFLPPKASNMAVVVTATGDDGAFRADLPAPGDYYVSVYQGPQQLYGRVANLDGNGPLTIVLKGEEGSPQTACSEPLRSPALPALAKPAAAGLDARAIDDALKLGRRWAQKNTKPGSIKMGNSYQREIVHFRPSIQMSIIYLTDRGLVALAEMRAQRLGRDLTAEEIKGIPTSGLFNVLVHVDEERSSEDIVPTYLGHAARAELRFKSKTLKALDLEPTSSPAHAEWAYIAKLFSDLGRPIGGPGDEKVQVGYKTRIYLKFSFAFAETRPRRDQIHDPPSFVLINSQGREDKLKILTWAMR